MEKQLEIGIIFIRMAIIHILFLMIIHGIGAKDLREVQTGYRLITKIIRRRINE